MGGATYKDTTGRVWTPDDFLLSVLLDESKDWTKEPLVLVNYRPLTQGLGLDPERKRFSLQELGQVTALEQIGREVHALRLRTSDAVLTREQQEAENVLTRMALLRQLLTGARMFIVPPPDNGGTAQPAPTSTIWLAPPDASQFYGEARFTPAAVALRGIAQAYLQGDGFNFSLHARELRGVLRQLNPVRYPPDALLARECFYNHLGAFPWAALLYFVGLGPPGGRRREPRALAPRLPLWRPGRGLGGLGPARPGHRPALRRGGPAPPSPTCTSP